MPSLPYLFGLVLTHLFYDVEQTYGSLYGEISGVFHVPSPLWDLEYADDTVLLSCSAQQLNRLFHIVQYHGQKKAYRSMKKSVSTSAFIPNSASTIPPLAPVLVIAGTALDLTTTSLQFAFG